MKKIIIVSTIMIIAGHSYAQLLYSNGARVTVNGANVHVNGSVLNKGTLDLKQTSNLMVKGDITNQGSLSNDGYVDVHGNVWSTSKIDNPVFGEWNFGGSTAQTITSDSAIIAKNLSFNNSAGFSVNVVNDLKVTNLANFIRGVVATMNSSKLRFGSAASHTSSSDTSHVNGVVAKEGTGMFNYPVGTGVKLQDVSVNASSNPTSIDVSYKASDFGPALFGITGAQATPLQSYNKAEYWQMNSGGALGSVTLKQDAFNPLAISNLPDVRVAQRNGTQWLNQGGTATGTVSVASIQSLNSTIDGAFTLGIIKKDISVAVINPSAKTSICFKDTLTINARRILGTNEFPTSTSFAITPASSVIKVNDTTFKLFPSVTTQFTLTGTDQNNLMGIVNFNLTVNQLPNVTASIKNPIIVNGVSLKNWPKDNVIDLVASGASSYVWAPNTFVNAGINSSNLIATPSSHITYSVIGTDLNGCKNTGSISLRTFVFKNEEITSCKNITWRGKNIVNTGLYGDTVSFPIVDTWFVLNFISKAVNTSVKFEDGKLASQCFTCQYQWYACKPDGTYTPIENAKSRVLNISTFGTYSVEVTNADGSCPAKSACLSNVSSGIASTNELEGIAVYPNPFVDKISVHLDKDPVNAYIQIIDLNGRVVTSKTVVKATNTVLNLEALAQGTYHIQIVFEKENKKIYYTKIVKD